MSFPSARFCAATDGNGDVFTTTDPADDAGNALITTRPAIASGEWVKQTVGDGAVLWDATCPNPSRWVAGDIDRRVFTGS